MKRSSSSPQTICCNAWRSIILILLAAFILQLQIISNDAFSLIRKNDNLCLHLFRGRQKRAVSDEGVGPPTKLLHTFPHNYNDTMIDQYFMDAALRQAQLAWKKDEVPIGAIIVQQTNNRNNTTTSKKNQVRTFRVISEAHNLVETNTDASAHAELLALRQGAQNLQNWRYPPNSTLYSTLEPCPMCLASAQAFRIDNIVYGAPDNRLGAIQTHMNLMKVAKHPYHDVKSVVSGVRSEECGNIMVDFFRERRRVKKETQQKSSVLETDGDPTQSRRERFRFSTIKNAIARMLRSR